VALTLSIVRAGRGLEANPLMRWSIRLAPWLAYVVGIISTAIASALGFYFLNRGHAALAYGWVLAILLFRLFCIALNYRTWRR